MVDNKGSFFYGESIEFIKAYGMHVCTSNDNGSLEGRGGGGGERQGGVNFFFRWSVRSGLRNSLTR